MRSLCGCRRFAPNCGSSTLGQPLWPQASRMPASGASRFDGCRSRAPSAAKHNDLRFVRTPSSPCCTRSSIAAERRRAFCRPVGAAISGPARLYRRPRLVGAAVGTEKLWLNQAGERRSTRDEGTWSKHAKGKAWPESGIRPTASSRRLVGKQRLQPIEQVERLARGEFVGADVAQQASRRRIARRGRSGARRAARNSGRSSASRARAPPSSPFSRISRISAARAVTCRRQSGELGDMDAVGAVGGAGRDLVQKHDVALPFLDPHRVAGERRQLCGERGQLVVMRREQRAAAVDLVQMLERRPGDRQPVIGRGAARRSRRG